MGFVLAALQALPWDLETSGVFPIWQTESQKYGGNFSAGVSDTGSHFAGFTLSRRQIFPDYRNCYWTQDRSGSAIGAFRKRWINALRLCRLSRLCGTFYFIFFYPYCVIGGWVSVKYFAAFLTGQGSAAAGETM